MGTTANTPVASGYFRNSGEGFTFDLPASWMSVAPGKVVDPSALFSMGSPGAAYGITKPIDGGKTTDLMNLVDTDVKVMTTDAPVMVKVQIHRQGRRKHKGAGGRLRGASL